MNDKDLKEKILKVFNDMEWSFMDQDGDYFKGISREDYPIIIDEIIKLMEK